ncbi:hypothetical protein [Pedobacter sp. MC2016-24]|uniref:hypothetical protein n=1 Tax=Pedobacter sp. MC2016-24 TaxID=2780090 RepID=UPI001880ACA3|nr:hypothetical protein [Pedobacter sp. MC2016-24]MBE9599832.1 hypothetical protein [Pedobacter sp. MC2016-24]
MDIHHLLNYLGTMFPLPPTFPVILSQIVYDQLAVHKQKLLEPPARARYAWFLKTGAVSASIFDKKGKEVVIRLYLPYVVFTDLNSFWYDRPSTLMLRAVGDVALQVISLNDFRKHLLLLYQTRELKDEILLQDQLLDQQRSGLISLSDQDRFSEFTSLYPMNKFPNLVAASFLNMSATKYCKLKAAWNAG